MPDPWYPRATRQPGAAAGYEYGHSTMELAVAHYTVGIDSTPEGLAGMFPILVRRDGEVVQFAEIDAITEQACEWNGRGPGIEIEYLPGPDAAVFTDLARAATAKLVHWLNLEWGIPLVYYDGPRLPIGAPYAGFVAHGSLVHHACDQHVDGWPRADWDAMVAQPPPAPGDDDVTILWTTSLTANKNYAYVPGVGMVFVENTDGPFQRFQISQADFDRMNAAR